MSDEKLTWLQSFVQIVKSSCWANVWLFNVWNFENISEKAATTRTFAGNASSSLILIQCVGVVCVRFRCLNTFLRSRAFGWIMFIRQIFAQSFNNNYAAEICKSIKSPPHLKSEKFERIFRYAVLMKSDDIINVFFAGIHNVAWIFGFLGEWLQRFYSNYSSPYWCSCM